MLEWVLEARLGTYFLPFIISHMHISIPLNRMFRDHSCYSMKYKLLDMNKEI